MRRFWIILAIAFIVLPVAGSAQLPADWDRQWGTPYTRVADAQPLGDTLLVAITDGTATFLNPATGDPHRNMVIVDDIDANNSCVGAVTKSGLIGMAATDWHWLHLKLRGYDPFRTGCIIQTYRSTMDRLTPITAAMHSDHGFFVSYFSSWQDYWGDTVYVYYLVGQNLDNTQRMFRQGQAYNLLAPLENGNLATITELEGADNSQLTLFGPLGAILAEQLLSYGFTDLQPLPDGSLIGAAHHLNTNWTILHLSDEGDILWSVPQPYTVARVTYNSSLNRVVGAGGLADSVFVTELDMSGQPIWQHLYPDRMYITDICVDGDQGILLGGYRENYNRAYARHYPRASVDLSTPIEPWELPAEGATLPFSFTVRSGQLPSDTATVELRFRPRAATSSDLISNRSFMLVANDSLTVTPPAIPLPDDLPDGNYVLIAYLSALDGAITLADSVHVIKQTSDVSADSPTTQPPTSFALHPIHPNPTNATATLTIDLPTPGQLEVSVHNLTGRLVSLISEHVAQPGTHILRLDASSWASGSYIIRASLLGQPDATTRLVVVK